MAVRGKEMGSKGKGKTTALNGGLSLPLLEVIINAEAFNNTEDKELKGFLEYLKTGKATNEFTREIETMVQAVKQNEQARQEYRLMSTFEMDARDKGAYDNKRETARILKQLGDSIQKIMQVTGLSESEIEKL